jgi:hypothetical protein
MLHSLSVMSLVNFPGCEEREEEEEEHGEKVLFYFQLERSLNFYLDFCSVLVGSEAAAEGTAPAIAPASRAHAAANPASFDADDEIMEAPVVESSKANTLAGSVSAKSSKRKGKSSPPLAVASAALPLQLQGQILSASAGSVAPSKSVATNIGSAYDASSDYLSSSSTSSLKHDDVASIALKQSTFQALKESFLSKPKNSGKKDTSKSKSVVNPVSQHNQQPAGIKIDAAVSSKPPRGRSPPAPASSEEIVKLDPLENPLRLASCAAFLAQPSYATVFEKKALCFDISHAKCYRWLVPRRSLVLIVDKDADLLRGVFETTGTVIMDPRKDVPSATSAHVPISPLKNELFSPISLSRVGHLINLNALCEETPFESLTTSQFSAILQMFSVPSVSQSLSKSSLAFDARDSKSVAERSLSMKQPSSVSSEISSDKSGRSPSSRSSHEAFDSAKVLPASGDFRQPVYASSVASFHQNAAAQPEPPHAATSARPLFMPFPANGASSGSSSLPSFPRFQPSAAPSVLAAASPFNTGASAYSSSRQYVPIEAEQLQHASFGTGSSGGYSPWGGFDQRIFGSNESPEFLLGGLRHEFQQGEAEAPSSHEDELATNFFWSAPSPSSQYSAGPQTGSRLFGKVDADQSQSGAMSLSAGMQSLDMRDHVGIHPRPWAPMERTLSSGFGVAGDSASNAFSRPSRQQWHNPSSESLDQRGKAVHKH